MDIDTMLWLVEHSAWEVTLFAAVGLAIGGLDDLIVDMVWLVRAFWRRVAIRPRYCPATARTLAAPLRSGRIAIFIGAWDEAGVIGRMLAATLDRFGEQDYRLFVGVYPNDPATMKEVRRVRRRHPQGRYIRMVNGELCGPTSKAEALNRLWAAMCREEERAGVPFKAIVLHDAEDVVHPDELRVFDTLIERFDLVQLPVLPLVDEKSRWVSGHYLDEFSEAHGKQLVVREAVGAGMPSAGVGCALSRAALERMAEARGGSPFDAASLTEDYELGLRLREVGGRGVFVQLPAMEGGALVAVRAFFPATFATAVRQKTRWMTGIALSGWDRLGWAGGIAEHWMRLRDRRAILAHLILAAAYLAMVLDAGALVARALTHHSLVAPPPALAVLLWITGGLLAWRLGMRALMVTRLYGWREGARSIPRTIVSNIIGMAAARRAVLLYAGLPGSRAAAWDKTDHHFPDVLPPR